MTALVLSGSIGAGHDTVAEVCAEALGSRSIDVDLVDCMSLLGGWQHQVGERVFQSMLAVPPVYDAFHFSALRGGSRLPRLMDQGAASRLVPAINEQYGDAGARLVISVFATGTGAAARLRQEHPDWRTVCFVTDASAHQIWVHDHTDRYLVCSPAAAGTVLQYDPRADVVVLPPPVRAQFFNAPSQDDARRRLGLVEPSTYVLMSGGGWGRGPLATSAAALAAAGYEVLLVAGRNHRLAAQARELATGLRSAARGGIRVFDFVEDMAQLMSAADIIVTSSGQTCHEARVVGRPLVLLDNVPGHGRENLLIELAAGGAIGALPSPDRVVSAVDAVATRDIIKPIDWPIGSPAEWHRLFLDAIGDLLPS